MSKQSNSSSYIKKNKLSKSIELLHFQALFIIIDWAGTDKIDSVLAFLPACSASLVLKVRMEDPTYSDKQRNL